MRVLFGVGLTHASDFGVGTGLTLLTVREMGMGNPLKGNGDRFKDRRALGWDAGYVDGSGDITQDYIKILNLISFFCIISKLNMWRNKKLHVYVWIYLSTNF